VSAGFVSEQEIVKCVVSGMFVNQVVTTGLSIFVMKAFIRTFITFIAVAVVGGSFVAMLQCVCNDFLRM